MLATAASWKPYMAAVTSVFPLTIIAMALGLLLGTGTGNRISVLLGKGDREGAERVLGQGEKVPSEKGLELGEKVPSERGIGPVTSGPPRSE